MLKLVLIALMVVFASAQLKPHFRVRATKPMTPPPCNPPPFMNKLPEDVQANIRKIWLSYNKASDDCSQQLEDTKALLDGLSPSARLSLRPQSPPGAMCGIPPFTEHLSAQNQQALKNIWAGYKKGDDCMGQREATMRLLDNLSKSEQTALVQGTAEPTKQ